MCKKLVFLMSLVLVIGLVGSASAVTEYTYAIQVINVGTGNQLAGSTEPPATRPFGFDTQYYPSYIILGSWGSCSKGLGWAKWDIPDYSAMGQTITKVELQVNVFSYNTGRPWAGWKATRVDDASWDKTTINHNWAISSDVVTLMEDQYDTGGGVWSWTTPLLTLTDITAWWTSGEQSVAGGEQFSIQLNQLAPHDTDATRQSSRCSSGDLLLIVTTVPEPTTIALLGLGGLVLIRKRR